MYALIEDGVVVAYPYTLDRVRRANPNTSFPVSPSDEALLSFGVHRVFNTPQPAYDETRQALEEVLPVFDAASSRWRQEWHVRDLTTEEVQQRVDAQAGSVRAERNQRLAESDWTQLADAPVDRAAWAAYRQALRDITAQPGFPMTVDWPVAP